MIGDEIQGLVLAPGSYIEYRTGQRHVCDKDCAASDHQYKHRIDTRVRLRFTRKRPLMGAPNKQIFVPDVLTSEDV